MSGRVCAPPQMEMLMPSSSSRSLSCLTLLLLTAACKAEPEAAPDTGVGDTGGTEADTGSTDGTDTEADAAPAIGNPTGAPQDIDHEAALSITIANVVSHMDGLQSSLAFLEASTVLQNAWSLLFEDADAGDPAAATADSKEGFEVDLSDLRDGAVAFLEERLMVAEFASVADDGRSIRYAVDPERLCAAEEELDSRSEREEQARDEAECEERFAASPLALVVTTDGPGRVDVAVEVGPLSTVFASVQLHDDVFAPFLEMGGFVEGLGALLGVEMPAVAEGRMAFEVRREGSASTSARFAVQENVAVGTASDTLGWSLEAHPAPGRLHLDGSAQTLTGELDLGRVEVGLPWTPEGDGAREDKRFQFDLPAVKGSLAYDGATGVFSLEDGSFGEEATRASVDGETVFSMNLNPRNGRRVSASLAPVADDDLAVSVTPLLDVEMAFSFGLVEDDFEELPSGLADDRGGVLFDGDEGGTLRTWTTDEGTEFQVASGTLVLWSVSRDEDIVIEEGFCIGSGEAEGSGSEDLWGDLVATACQP